MHKYFVCGLRGNWVWWRVKSLSCISSVMWRETGCGGWSSLCHVSHLLCERRMGVVVGQVSVILSQYTKNVIPVGQTYYLYYANNEEHIILIGVYGRWRVRVWSYALLGCIHKRAAHLVCQGHPIKQLNACHSFTWLNYIHDLQFVVS